MENSAAPAPRDTRTISLREEISKRARLLWEHSGNPEGRDEEFWLKAEGEILGADPSIRAEGAGAIDAKQYAQATDANKAKAARRSNR